MKRVLFILTVFVFSTTLHAEHITGGEMSYTYQGFVNNLHRYHVTLKLYRDCNSGGAPLDANAPIGIYNNTNGVLVWDSTIALRTPILHVPARRKTSVFFND